MLGCVARDYCLLMRQLNARFRRAVRMLSIIRVTGLLVVITPLVGVCPWCPCGVTLLNVNRRVLPASTAYPHYVIGEACCRW